MSYALVLILVAEAVFTFLYWLLDGGGPEARIWHPPEFPHLAFPEHLNPVVAPPGWLVIARAVNIFE
jgi:hypothetical protein